MSVEQTPLSLKLRAARKEQTLNLKALWLKVRTSKALQGGLLAVACTIIVASLFSFLVSLVGAAVAALCMLFVLDQFFGLKMPPHVSF